MADDDGLEYLGKLVRLRSRHQFLDIIGRHSVFFGLLSNVQALLADGSNQRV